MVPGARVQFSPTPPQFCVAIDYLMDVPFRIETSWRICVVLKHVITVYTKNIIEMPKRGVSSEQPQFRMLSGVIIATQRDPCYTQL